MKSIIRTGMAMTMLAIVLIALSVAFMRANAGVVSNENRPVEAQVVNITMAMPVLMIDFISYSISLFQVLQSRGMSLHAAD